MTRAALKILAVASACAALAGCSFGGTERVGGERPAQTRELTLLDPFNNRQELTEFVGEVARLSRGRLRIRLIPAGHDGPDFEAATIRDMQRGRADLAYAASRAWDEFGARRLPALGAPFLIDSYRLEERVLTSGLVDSMLEELRPLGLEGIGILPGPIQRPFGATDSLATPSDFSGLTIGTQQSRVADATLRALGAHPRRLPADVTTMEGLDGVEHRIAAIEGARLDADGSHLMTNVNLWARPIVLFATEPAYTRLSREQRRILRTAAANVVPAKLANERGLEAETAANICRKGRARFDAATPAELQALRRAVQPVYRELERDPETRGAIKAIKRLKTQLAEPPTEAIKRLKTQLAEPPTEVELCGRAAEPRAVGTATTAIDGVWRMVTDRRAARPDYLDENWGDWIYVFDRGKFAITQENAKACTWGYGTYAVEANRMSWTFSDGGGIAPNGAMKKPGEYFEFDFSAYRDTLTLTPVKGQISPRNFRDKPWRQISNTPSRRYFSKRCPPPAAAPPG